MLGDVLVAFDCVSVRDTADVLALLNFGDRVGKSVTVQIVRGGTLVELAIRLATDTLISMLT
jgi:S1-C subfamily serine protease